MIFLYKTDKQIVAFKGTNKNDVMRQAGFLGDSYSSKTPPLNICKMNTTFFKPLWDMFCANAKLI